MEEAIEKYISKNNIIKLILYLKQDSKILNYHIYINCSAHENKNILQKIIHCGKYISVDICYELDSYKNIDILRYADEISIYNPMTRENIIDLIHCSANLRKLTMKSSHILEIGVKNKLREKKFLKYIKIMLSVDVNLDDIYELMEIKSIDTLFLYEYSYNNFLNYEKIFKILYHCVNNLNKNVKIIIVFNGQDDIFRKFISLITYNFKINNHNYIFTYITKGFRQFDNLYDFNLYYQ